MNTKEAIDLLERLKNPHLGWLKEHNDNIDNIIALLQRGEKYEEMWKEFSLNEGDLVRVVNCIKHRYEQKYFPKPVKKTITIEIKGDDDINLGLATVIMKKAFDDLYCSPSMNFILKEESCS